MTLPRGLRAVVTGGGSGLGQAFCQRLVLADARVVVADVDLARAEAVAEELRRAGGVAHPFEVDVGDVAQMNALAVRASALLGGVDLLANNAGVAVSGQFEEIPLPDWRWIVDVNMWGVIHGCRAFLPLFSRQGRGYVINVASAAGLISLPEMSPYNMTKAAVVALSETLFSEYRSQGVNVTVLCPTFFRTRIVDAGRGVIDAQRFDAVQKLMDRSKLQAPEVAQFALDAVAEGRLYAVPMRDGRLIWRAWRAAPERVQRLLAGKVDRYLNWFR